MATAVRRQQRSGSKVGAERAWRAGEAPPRGKGAQAPAIARIERLRRSLQREDASHLLVSSGIDVGYLTGFLGGDSYLLVPVDGRERATIISDGRFDEELEPQRASFEVIIRKTTMWMALAQLLRERSIQRLAIQAEVVTLADKRQLESHTEGAGLSIAETKGLVSRLRAVKDAEEVEAIRGAIKIQQAALKAILPKLKPGMTELAVAALLEGEMKLRGSSSPAFESIVAAKANGSLPHYCPAKEKLAKGRPLLIDWGATWRGYRGDMTRTFTFGKWPTPLGDVYKVVLEAHKLAAAAIRPGTSGKAIDAVAREHIAKHGFGEQFSHSLGHGLGMAVHEEPRLSHLGPESNLEVGMVVTIEPGVYIPGVGGVRIEDDYVVTGDGAQNLCTLPKEARWAVL
jgi:Xaa-Pro aminopeptidase